MTSALWTEHIISNPAHYTEGRTIEPIEVIENFNLCHHLACVVKYLARAGRKTNFLRDLQKAEWYLSREIDRLQNDKQSCNAQLRTKPLYTIQEILDDWNISFHLSACLFYILDSQLSKSNPGGGFIRVKKKLHHKEGSTLIDTNYSLLSSALNYLRIVINDHQNQQRKNS